MNGPSPAPSPAYVLGHEDRELERLEQQAELFGGMTRDILVRAGVGPGMKVLDIGCGVGDVSRIAAELVGPEGGVYGVDISENAVALARRRLEAADMPWASFDVGQFQNVDDLARFDAVIGRFILIHLPDPAAEVARLAAGMRPGGVIAFVEFDLSTAAARPPLPLLETCIGWIQTVYRGMGLEMDMGAGMYGAFRSAGLAPEMIGHTRITNGEDTGGLHFVVESVRSMLPALEKLGVARAEDVDIDTLLPRLVAEASGGDHCIFYPRLVGGWARAPQET